MLWESLRQLVRGHGTNKFRKMDAIKMNQETTAKMDHRIHRLSEKDHFRTATDFQNEICATYDLNICARAVRKYLRDFGPEGRVFRKNSIFSRKNQKLGIAFAKTHKHRTFQDLGKVFLLMKQNLVECNNEQLWIIVYLLFIISIIYQENSCLKIVSTAVCKKNISFLCFIEINRLCNYLKSLIL